MIVAVMVVAVDDSHGNGCRGDGRFCGRPLQSVMVVVVVIVAVDNHCNDDSMLTAPTSLLIKARL